MEPIQIPVGTTIGSRVTITGTFTDPNSRKRRVMVRCVCGAVDSIVAESFRRGHSFGCKKCRNLRRVKYRSLTISGLNRESTYGIDEEDYATWLAAQDNRCRICGTTNPGGRGVFYVDHCHDSKKLRGLLCHNCNSIIGFAHDDPGILREAAAYLERTKTTKIKPPYEYEGLETHYV